MLKLIKNFINEKVGRCVLHDYKVIDKQWLSDIIYKRASQEVNGYHRHCGYDYETHRVHEQKVHVPSKFIKSKICLTCGNCGTDIDKIADEYINHFKEISAQHDLATKMWSERCKK